MLVEWVLPHDLHKHTELWEILLRNTAFQHFFKLRDQLHSQRRPIYMSAVDGGPLGWFMAQIIHDQSKARALLVAAYGNRNTVPCAHCEQHFLGCFQSLPGQDGHIHDGGMKVHTIWPFFDCVSLPGYADGACANCILGGKGPDCRFARLEYVKDVKSLRASRRNSIDGAEADNRLLIPPRKVTPMNSPRAGPNLSLIPDLADIEEYQRRGV
jgi:hypothetical protein